MQRVTLFALFFDQSDALKLEMFGQFREKVSRVLSRSKHSEEDDEGFGGEQAYCKGVNMNTITEFKDRFEPRLEAGSIRGVDRHPPKDPVSRYLIACACLNPTNPIFSELTQGHFCSENHKSLLSDTAVDLPVPKECDAVAEGTEQTDPFNLACACLKGSKRSKCATLSFYSWLTQAQANKPIALPDE